MPGCCWCGGWQQKVKLSEELSPFYGNEAGPMQVKKARLCLKKEAIVVFSGQGHPGKSLSPFARRHRLHYLDYLYHTRKWVGEGGTKLDELKGNKLNRRKTSRVGRAANVPERLCLCLR